VKMTGCKEEMKLVSSAFGRMNIVFKSNIPLSLKKKAYEQCVLPFMTYECKIWMLNSGKIQCKQRSVERCMLGITRSYGEFMDKKNDQNGRYSGTCEKV
jgi:hypothetical protein